MVCIRAVVASILRIFINLSSSRLVASQNFNPGTSHSVRCDGPLPDFGLPVLPGWNLSQSTLQEICAMQAYGGEDPEYQGELSRNLNFFCLGSSQSLTSHRGPPQVAFSAQGRDSILRNPRLLLYCRDRCYCDRWVDPNSPPLTQKPEGVPASNLMSWISLGSVATLDITPSMVYEIKVEERDDFTNPTIHQLLDRQMMVWTTRIRSANWRFHGASYGLFPQPDRYVSLDPLNYIKCESGSLPRYLTPPAPYDNADQFPTILEFCGTAFSGGNPAANSGGYCHNTPTKNGLDLRQVFFSDDLTPRVDWTWSGSLVWTARARFFCWSKCWCAHQPRRHRRSGAGMWRILDDMRILGLGDGTGNIMLQKADNGHSTLFPILNLPKQIDSAGQSGECRVQNVDICHGWPSNVLGPKPTTPPLPTNDIEMASLVEESLTCGQECSGSAATSCARYEDVDGCQCVRVSQPIAQLLGLDLMAAPPSWKCLSVTVLITLIRSKNGHIKRSDLAGNSGPNDQRYPLELADWNGIFACRCNATFADAGCCKIPAELI